MKKYHLLPAWLVLSALAFGPATVRASEGQLSGDRLDILDRHGYMTPAFKAAVRDYVTTKDALEQTLAADKNYSGQLPDLQKQSDAAKTRTESLRLELNTYQHPEADDYSALQAIMKDPSAKLEDQLATAEAYAWGYPNDPHAAEAQQDVDTIQKKLADQAAAEAKAEADRAAAEAALMKRVQARDLSLNEWKDFLNDKSQGDLLKYLGRPDLVHDDYWVYSTAFTKDPYTGQTIGLEISFNGTRVNAVAAGPRAGLTPTNTPSANP